MKRFIPLLVSIVLAAGAIGLALSSDSGQGRAHFASMVAQTSPLPSGCYTDASGLPVCGPNYAGPGGGAANIVAGVCTSPRPSPPPTGAIAVDYTCATPGPQATPSPSATSTTTAGPPSVTWSGSWPYQLAINFPAAGGGTTPTYDATVLAEASATHYWKFADNPNGCASACTPGPCPSTMADSIASGATALPSPVPLSVATPSAVAPPTCGMVGIVKDGTTSAAFTATNTVNGGSFSVPSAVFETLCKAGGGTCNLPWTLECIASVGASQNATYNYLFSIDTTGTAATVDLKSANGSPSATWEFYAGTHDLLGNASGIVPSVMVDYKFDGSSTTTAYLNGVINTVNAFAPAKADTSLSFLGWDGTNAARAWNGRIEKCSTYNTALSDVKIMQHYAATGLP